MLRVWALMKRKLKKKRYILTGSSELHTVHGKTATEVVPLHPFSSFSPHTPGLWGWVFPFNERNQHNLPICEAKRPLTRYSGKLVSEMTPDSVNLTTLTKTMSLDLNNVSKKSFITCLPIPCTYFQIKLSTAAIQAHPILYHIVIVTPNTVLK